MILNRPKIFMNTAMSLDGKISTAPREQVRFSSAADWDFLDELRARADAILIGAGTLRAEDPPIGIRSQVRQAERIKRGKTPHPLSVVLSRSLDLPIDRPFFHSTLIKRLVVTIEAASSERVERVTPFAEICQFGKDNVDLEALCSYLKQRGIESLLVEGGGEVNMAFFQARLMDEIYTTLCPVVIGGHDAPTPVDGAGFSSDELTHLELLDQRQVDQEIFLHYRVIHEPDTT